MTAAGTGLSIGGYSLTFLGVCVTIRAACAGLRRTSVRSPREWARHQVEKVRVRLRLPIHRPANLTGHGQTTSTAALRVTRGPIAEFLQRHVYETLDTLLLQAQTTNAKTEDIKRDADKFMQEIMDQWGADRAHMRSQAKMALVGSAFTIAGIVLCVVAVLVN
jgi:hypothetical protein